MKVAVIGSRSIKTPDLSALLPEGCDEIVSGGARGVDSCAAAYARTHGLKLTEIPPEYQKFGRAAPLVRNRRIVDYADCVLAIWDGTSHGTKYVIRYCETTGTPCRVVLAEKKN